MRARPREVPDGLWERIERLLPKKPRLFRYPVASRSTIVLLYRELVRVAQGIRWEHLAQELALAAG